MNALALPDPTENDAHLALSAAEAAEVAASLPLAHRFQLGATITPVQHAFLDLHGFLVFAQVASQEEVDGILAAVDAVQEQFLAEGREKVHGVPIWRGADDQGRPFIQRFAYLSVFSDYVRAFVTDARFEPVRKLIGDDARIGHDELDGVVFNRYIKAPGSLRPQLGWHTDGLRDIFYGELPGPMLNVGLHFRRIRFEDGGLRLIPGTHKQGFWSFVFGKAYFLDHRPDSREIPVETWPGDLTVHDGRLWHRVAASRYEGGRSLRESMYVPYVTGIRKPQTEESETKSYMKVLAAGMRIKAWLVGQR